MSAMASQITSLTTLYSTVYSGADQRKHQSSAPLAFVRGIHWWPVNSLHKVPVTRKMILFDDDMVSLKLFLRLPVVLSSSPLKILEGFCCGIHSNRIHVIRNDLICFIEEGLFCLYNGRKTDRIWNCIFQRGQSSMVAIGPDRLCLVKIYIYEKTTFWLKIIWHKIGPSKNCHISPSYTIGHGVSNDAKYSVVYSSHLCMMGTTNWCVTS